MTYYIEYTKDVIDNNYLAVKIPNGIIEPFLREMKQFLSEDEYDTFVDNQQKRDKGAYHSTVISVAEFNKLSDVMGMDKFVSSLQSVFKYEIDDLKMLGIGTAQKSTNKTFFIVCESDKLDAVRDFYGLDKKDFHITIGFKWKDVFGVRKNVVIKKESVFIDMLKQEYLNKKNWEFVRNIENYDLSDNSQIIPVRLDDNNLTVKCDGYYLTLSYMEDSNKLRITNKYPIEGYGLPRLTQHDIDNKFSIQ